MKYEYKTTAVRLSDTAAGNTSVIRMFWTWERKWPTARRPCPNCGSIARRKITLGYERCIGCDKILDSDKGAS